LRVPDLSHIERACLLLASKWLRTGEFRIIDGERLLATIRTRQLPRPVGAGWRGASAAACLIPPAAPSAGPSAPRTTSGHYA
jgi:hypothetical protein